MKKANPWMLLGALLGALVATTEPGSCADAAAEVHASHDLEFLRDLTRDVVAASRVKPGQKAGGAPTNSCGFTLIMPGGRGSYPAFWVRDFAMSLESGFVTAEEMLNHLRLTARCQNGPVSRKLKNGLVVPPYAIPDHINFDGGAVFYPGTYSSGDDQGTGAFGILPPVDDHYEFVHIAWCLFRATGKTDFLREAVNGMPLLERLAAAFAAPKTEAETGLVVTDDAQRAVGFGFCDAISFTGQILFPSLLRYRAAGQLAELSQALRLPDRAGEYRKIQLQIAENLAPTFGEAARIQGWLMAATRVGRQPDVWGTVYALHLGAIQGAAAERATETVIDAVRRQTIVFEGAVRHVPTDFDASSTSAWERTGVGLNTYQNGAYWHTPTGWLIEAVRRRDPQLASQLFSDYIQHLRAKDFRRGPGHEAPWECFGPKGYAQNGIYMTSVTLPWAVLSPRPAPVQKSAAVAQTLENDVYRLTLAVAEGQVEAILEDKRAGFRPAAGACLHRADRLSGNVALAYPRLEDPSVTAKGDTLTLEGELAGLRLEQTFVLPRTQPWMEERIVVRNPTDSLIALSDFEAGFRRRVADLSGQVHAELARDRWIAVPLRARATDPKGHLNDFAIRDLLTRPGYEPSVNKDQAYSQTPSRHRHSEGWAWTHGDAALGITTFNQENMLFSVVSTGKGTDGDWLRFGGACMISGEPAALTRIGPGQAVDLGIVRYQTTKGGYTEATYAFRAMLDEKGCRFPRDYNPPVHWEQLYDMPEAWTDRSRRYTRAIVEKEARKGRDYSCEALYLDPGWDTDFGTFLWGEPWLGPRKQFIEEMKSKYDLTVSLHCPLATWMSHQYSWGLGAVKTWPEGAARLAPEKADEDRAARLQVPALREGRRNLALLPDAKPNASSVFMKGAMPIHQTAHLNDGWFGNSASWITETMPAWAEVDLGAAHEIAEVRVGNDHAQQYRDRAATEIRVLVATNYAADSGAPNWRAVAQSKGEALQAEKTFAFAPSAARWVRVVLLRSGADMPRLDEIEIYEAKPVSQKEAESFVKGAKRGAKPQAAGQMLGPLLCLGSKQYLDEAEKRLLANCADGAVFLMYDGNWWNGGCLSTHHGHPVPYRYEDHTRANLDLAQRVHAKYPKVLIEMHDTIAGGSTARVTPVYYKYGLLGSYDENWGFELMWDPLADLKEARTRSLYYYNLGCNVPIYLHVNLNKDNESCVVLWWYASTCRHLGIGGTSPNPSVVAAQKKAMKRYRELDRFYKRGEFFGISEEIHLHVLPAESAFVVNVFNLSDQPRVIAGEINLARLGLDPKRRYATAEGLGTVLEGRYHVSIELPPWNARVAEIRPAE